MFQLTVLYNQPADPDAFDRYYRDTHIPLAKKIPGVQRFTVSHPAPDENGTKPDYHLVAVLEFADQDAFAAGMGGPEGEAAVADTANFAQAGMTLLTGESIVA